MSRYPAMSQAPAAYDRSLLVGAPSPTRADRQAGYDINALEQGRYVTQHPFGNPIVPAASNVPPTQPTAANPFEENYSRDPSPSPIPPKQPWWKTKRGRLILCFALIVFIGIICGIAAGVATAKNSRNTTTLIENQNSASSPAAVSGPNTSRTAPSASTANPVVTRTTLNPFSPTTTQGGTTIHFGGGPSPTLPDGVLLPTNTAPGSGDVADDGDMPQICYIFPFLSECAPYIGDRQR
jgi:hypothetical protein